MNTKVDLADIAIFEHSLVTCVGSVMSSTVVQGASSGETNARLESVGLDQVTGTILNHFHDINHGHARLDVTTSVLANLTMNLSSSADLVVLVKLFPLQSALFLVCCSPQVPGVIKRANALAFEMSF